MNGLNNPEKTKILRRQSYNIETEGSRPPLCPLSWSGTPEGVRHIFYSPLALQASLVYCLPAWMKEATVINQTKIRKIFCKACS